MQPLQSQAQLALPSINQAKKSTLESNTHSNEITRAPTSNSNLVQQSSEFNNSDYPNVSSESVLNPNPQQNAFICNDQKHFKINKESQLSKQSRSHKKMGQLKQNEQIKAGQIEIAKIVSRRKQLENQMLRLQFEQNQQKLRLKESIVRHNPYRNFRSNFDKNDQEQIKKIRQRSLEFENKMQLQNKELQKQMQSERKKEIKERMLLIEKLRQRKSIQSKLNVTKIKQQNQERLKRIQQENKRFQKVKKEKAKFQKIEQMHKEIEQQNKRKQQDLLQKNRKKKQFEMEEIKEHQRKYSQLVKAQKTKTQQFIHQKKQKISKNTSQYLSHFRKSTFFQNLVHEQYIKEEQEKWKTQYSRIIQDRKTAFGQSLRKRHRQQLTQSRKQDAQIEAGPTQSQLKYAKARSLSSTDIYKLGHENMVKANSQVTMEAIKKSKIDLSKHYDSLKFDSSRTAYKDYLQESKMRRLSLGKNNELKPEQRPELRQLRSVLKRQQNERERLQKAKLISQKLDKKAKNNNTNMMVSSIAAKLQIINQFI